MKATFSYLIHFHKAVAFAIGEVAADILKGTI